MPAGAPCCLWFAWSVSGRFDYFLAGRGRRLFCHNLTAACTNPFAHALLLSILLFDWRTFACDRWCRPTLLFCHCDWNACAVLAIAKKIHVLKSPACNTIKNDDLWALAFVCWRFLVAFGAGVHLETHSFNTWSPCHSRTHVTNVIFRKN